MTRKTNPGGQLAPSEVVGRDALIARIWDALETQSVILTAERRIGKTSVTMKMKAEPRPRWKPVYQDLEKVHTAQEFALEVYQQVKEFLKARQKIAVTAAQWFEKLGGTEIGGVLRLPDGRGKEWKPFLESTIRDLTEQTEKTDQRLIFFWDEMPYMLDSIRRRDGEATAFEVLDVLRSLRQTTGVRMVLTGSIGLHHVLKELQSADYRNAPLNDMHAIEVTPLATEDAATLARELVVGEAIRCNDLDAAGEAIAMGADRFPFYIQALVRCLKESQRPADPQTIEEAIQDQLVDSRDPWELAHFRTRLRGYYPDAEDLALAVLDTLATNAEAGTFPIAEIHNAVKTAGHDVKLEHLRELLKLLARDHYLEREPDGTYRFKFPLIRRWWALDRGL